MISLIKASWAIVLRDYRVRFRRTIFGFFWFLLPFFSLIALVMLLGKDVGLYSSHDSSKYFINLLTGLILWQLMSDSWAQPIRLARRANMLLLNVPFDRKALIVAGALNALVAFVLKLPILLATLLWFDSSLSTSLFLTPIAVLCLISTGMALACFTLPISLGLLDIRYILPFIQAILLLSTPIIYSSPTDGIVQLINLINPFTHLIVPMRDIISNQKFDISTISIIVMCTGSILVLAKIYFDKKIGLAAGYVGR